MSLFLAYPLRLYTNIYLKMINKWMKGILNKWIKTKLILLYSTLILLFIILYIKHVCIYKCYSQSHYIQFIPF